MKKSKQIVLLSFILILAMSSSLGLLYKYNDDQQKFETFIQSVNVIPEQIRYYDEVLTMSARMAAFTHKSYWIKRYNNAITPLDNVINKAKELFPNIIKELTKIDKANQILISFEMQSIEFVKQEQFDKAQGILLSNEYSIHKKAYSAGLQNVIKNIRSTIHEKEKSAENEFKLLGITIAIVIITAGLLGCLLFLILSRQTKELEELSTHLEEKVIERTESLKQTNELFKEAQRLTHLGNWEWNIIENKLIWSDEIYRIFGLKPQEFAATYDAFINTIHKDDQELVENAVNTTLTTGNDYDIRHRVVRPDGIKRVVIEKGRVEFDNNQKPIRMIGTVQDITENIEIENKLKFQEKLASTDKLTGIYNRHKFETIFEKELERVERYKSPLSIIMFDIDHFKSVNDTYGHDVGDMVLKKVVDLVKEHIRTTDVFARWGGEEFLILCPEIDRQKATILAEKLRSQIETASFGEVDQITSSFGLTTYKDKESKEIFIKRVDNALYQAKNEGRNMIKTLLD